MRHGTGWPGESLMMRSAGTARDIKAPPLCLSGACRDVTHGHMEREARHSMVIVRFARRSPRLLYYILIVWSSPGIFF